MLPWPYGPGSIKIKGMCIVSVYFPNTLLTMLPSTWNWISSRSKDFVASIGFSLLSFHSTFLWVTFANVSQYMISHKVPSVKAINNINVSFKEIFNAYYYSLFRMVLFFLHVTSKYLTLKSLDRKCGLCVSWVLLSFWNKAELWI